MKKNKQTRLIEEIKRRLPDDSKLTDVLTKTLGISKEAAYRRLRNEVPFTFEETAILAKDFGISLDNMVGVEVQKSKPFQLKLPEFVYPKNEDIFMFDDFIGFLKKLVTLPNTESGTITNAIPQDIFSGFFYLMKFNLFKWQYYYHNNDVIHFHDLVVCDKVKDSMNIQFQQSKHIKNSYFIFDNHIYERIVNDLKFFKNIQLIKDEDISKIKDDLLNSLDYLESLTFSGRFPETNNRISIYITNVDITTSYSYIKSDETNYSLIKTFLLTSATSLDTKISLKIQDWIKASIRTSTLISQVNEIERIIFFRTQREMVNSI